MKDLFIANLDIVDYVMNGELDKVASVVTDLRDNTQKAYIPSYEEQTERTDKDFALIISNSKNQLRKFACYNPELTELNLAFLANSANDLPDEVVKVAATNLTAAAHKFGIQIPEELSDYSSKRYCNRTVDTDAINMGKYAAKCKTKKAEVAKPKKCAIGTKCPIDTKENITKSANWFVKNRAHLTSEEQLEFIDNISVESGVLGVDLTKTAMANFVGLDRNTFNDEIFNHISVRKSLLTDDNVEMKETYNDLIRRSDELGPVKVACVLEILDKETNLAQYYGQQILDPVQTTFGVIKTAGKNIDGVFITKEQLLKIANDSLTELVGNDLITELRGEDGLDILNSLPKPIRNEILNKIK